MTTSCPTCQQPAAPGATCLACGMAVPALELAHGGMVSPHSLPKGTRLRNETYAIGDVLGQGGFGITYKGGDLNLKRYVAIKEFFPLGAGRQGSTLLPSGHTTQDQFRQQRESFVSEARTLAKFSHPGIVRVFGVFEENNTAYIVMEMLEGRTLQQILDEKGRLPEAETLDIIRQVGSALEMVHAAGMLHRDIKPDNILLVERPGEAPRAVLIDFGTARAFNVEQTRAMTAQLTPAYAPLEQYAQQAHFGAYTDIYALAGTCYHCLTGKLPPSAMDRLSGVELVPPNQLRSDIKPTVSQAIMHGLEVKAPARPQNVREFLEELDRTPAVLPDSPAFAPAVLPNWMGPGAHDHIPLPQMEHAEPPTHPNRTPYPLIIGSMLIVSFLLVAWNSARPVSDPQFDPAAAPNAAVRPPAMPPPSSLPPLNSSDIYNEAVNQLQSKLPASWNYNVDTYIDAGTGVDGRWSEPAGIDPNNPQVCWATGAFKYTGPPITLKFRQQLLDMNGHDDPGGFTTVVWSVKMGRGPFPGQYVLLDLQFQKV